MAFNINTTPVKIMGSTGTTSTGAGNWYRVHPNRGPLSIQVTHSGASVGATVQSTVYIQVSNDGVNPLLTTAGTSVDALATIVTNGGSPQSQGFTMNGGWEYIRAFINSLSTGSIDVSVGSMGRS